MQGQDGQTEIERERDRPGSAKGKVRFRNFVIKILFLCAYTKCAQAHVHDS